MRLLGWLCDFSDSESRNAETMQKATAYVAVYNISNVALYQFPERST